MHICNHQSWSEISQYNLKCAFSAFEFDVGVPVKKKKNIYPYEINVIILYIKKVTGMLFPLIISE